MEPHTADRLKSEIQGRLRGTVVVVNPQGLHMRPAMAFVRTAQAFVSKVTVWQGERSVNGKSLIDLLLLAAEPGSELIVEVDGSDAPSALPALMEILAAPAAEDLDGESDG
ncbi:MAG: HPr family phosphocarrier protein [Planctomycetes bacterium]|nr:HPr family phosphocarrier protein [Planctomycetota bacterium]